MMTLINLLNIPLTNGGFLRQRKNKQNKQAKKKNAEVVSILVPHSVQQTGEKSSVEID